MTAVASVESASVSRTSALPPAYLRPVVAVAGVFVGLELLFASRYGIHRDELYFLACARHLAWGYVDQPPLVPAVARVSTAMFGTSAFSLRLLPAIVGGACVCITAFIARELGGGRQAQVLAALAAATSAQVLAIVHLLSTAAFDLFFWAAITFWFVRLVRTADPRWWLAIGATTGAALLNKYNVAFLLFALVVGLIAGRRADLLRSKWTVGGAAIAVVLVAPNLAWNAQHNWAALEMLHSLHAENSTLGASISFIPLQLFVVGPILAPFWIGGWRRLWRDEVGRSYAIAYVTLLVVEALAGAKTYYIAGVYFGLFAGGGVWLEERLASGRARLGTKGIAVCMMVGALISLPLTLPALPERALATSGWEGGINKDLSATVGWKPIVRQLAQVMRSLPAAERDHVVIFTGDYGAAGAVDLYGRSLGLPTAISGHNNYWIWGPRGAPSDGTTIAVNVDRSHLETIFASVEPAGTVATPHGVWTEERGAPIFVCRNQRVPWLAAWASAKHYG
jgi:hypothetical protein